MPNPYRIEGPALVSFSGGRTSGYLLWHILDAFDGALPENVHVAFANTGKEMPETLDFVQRCGQEWSVPITWLEYDPEAEHKTKTVSHNSAARNGEPYVALTAGKAFLPNPVKRFCTTELKVRRFKVMMRHWLGYDHWSNIIGIRADEPRRAVRQMKPTRDRWHNVMPLVYADVTAEIVGKFWQAQGFDLALPNINGTTPYGNCDLCFLKSAATIQGIMRDRPDLAKWWLDQEAIPRGKGGGATFRADRPSYAAMFDNVSRQGDFFDDGPGILDCMCTE